MTGKAVEDEFVEGPHGVPIQKAWNPVRCKIGCDREQGFLFLCSLRGGFELQPGFAGDDHFSAQAHEPILFHVFHAPEIKRFAGVNFIGVAAAAAQAHPADCFIHPATDGP